jgi:hypothetical protein
MQRAQSDMKTLTEALRTICFAWGVVTLMSSSPAAGQSSTLGVIFNDLAPFYAQENCAFRYYVAQIEPEDSRRVLIGGLFGFARHHDRSAGYLTIRRMRIERRDGQTIEEVLPVTDAYPRTRDGPDVREDRFHVGPEPTMKSLAFYFRNSPNFRRLLWNAIDTGHLEVIYTTAADTAPITAKVDLGISDFRDDDRTPVRSTKAIDTMRRCLDELKVR